MFKVGLTGGIASGKSLVADLFAEAGASIVDTDLIAREVVAPGEPGLAAIVEQFGDEVIDATGELDRRHMRTLIFGSESRRQQLENLLHPLIRTRTLTRIDSATGPYVMVVVPLLAETGFAELVDRVLVVDCDEATQTRRLMARDVHTSEEARRIIAAQASRAERLAVADDVIDNNGDVASTHQQVLELHNQYVSLG
jgi:dephospho-CoA kinase